MTMAGKQFIWGLGRRKTSVARVRIAPGSGQFLVNERSLEDYFPVDRFQRLARKPLEVTEAGGRFDIFINVDGGGQTGQVGACMLGISRALAKAEPASEAALRRHGLMTRDSRMVERKKYGLRGARRGCQFSKR
jgi:small subunit ribosomal protein S9